MTLQDDLRASLGAVFAASKKTAPTKKEEPLKQLEAFDMSVIRDPDTGRIDGAVTANYRYHVTYDERGRVTRIHAEPLTAVRGIH